MATFHCKNCGKPFNANPSKKPIHCSRECQKATGLKKRMRTCQQCGKGFEVDTSAREGKYCGKGCSAEAQRVRVTYVCRQCGSEFLEQPSEKRDFCSRKCFTDSMRGHTHNTGRPSPFNRNPGRDILIGLYVEQLLSPADIGSMYGVKDATVLSWLHKEGIAVRQAQLTSNAGKEPKNKIPIPPKHELEVLYIQQDASVNQLSRQYNVSKTTMLNWLKFYNLPVGHLNKNLYISGLEHPSAEELSRMIHDDNMSYADVGKIYGVDQSLVPIWLDAFGVQRSQTWHDTHNNPGDISAMKALYDDGLSLDEIGQRYGVGKGPVATLFRANGIPIRKDGWQGKRFLTKRGDEVRSTYERKVANWLHDQGLDYAYEPQLPFSSSGAADFLANGWYIEIWGVTGNASYKQRKEIKRAGYAAANAPLVEIYAHSFSPKRNSLWIRQLQVVLTSPY